MVIVLDTFPASSTGKQLGKSPSTSVKCQEWISDCENSGHIVLVPAVVYYEALREYELQQMHVQISRLKAFCLHPKRYLPLNLSHWELAAQLWAQARRNGKPTADPQALDCDVLLAAQAICLGLPTSEYIVATTNPKHLSLFVPCDVWTNISP